MKPEHFLYKSDGLYYMQNVPMSASYCDCKDCIKATERRYNEALERAKEEAVLVTDPYVYQIAIHRYFPHFIDYSKTPQDNFAMCASIGQVYLLNIEEKIEVVEEDTVEDGGGCYVAGSRRFARIAAPKKEEESIIWNEWLSKVVDGEGYIISTKFREAQKQFEIKRKPL